MTTFSMRPRSRRATVARLLALALSLGSGRALGQELEPPVDSSLAAVPLDAGVARPSYLTPIVEPAFKTRLTRITDAVATPRPPSAGLPSIIRHSYSRTQAWNSDGSLLRIGGLHLLDGKTYQKVGTYGEYSSETFWSHSQPNVMYAFSPPHLDDNGNPVDGAIVKTTLSKNAQTQVWSQADTILRTFPYASPYTQMYMGRWEGRPSEDDRYAALVARVGSALRLFVVDLSQPGAPTVSWRDFSGKWPAGSEPLLDWASVSPSGQYVVVGWTQAGTGWYQGVEVYARSLSLSSRRHLVEKLEHGDLCWQYEASGQKIQETWVQLVTGTQEAQNVYAADLAAWRLSDGVRLTMMPRPSDIDFGGHVSCANYNRPGWAYVTAQPDGSGPLSQIFATKIQDNSQGSPVPVQAFAHHRANASVPNAPDGYNYASQAQASTDPWGLRVLFASNWGAMQATSEIYSYIAERPSPIQILSSATPAQVVISASSTLPSTAREMRVFRQNWQALTLKTPSGVTIPATDLLFYSTSTGAPSVDNLPGAYWLDPDPTKGITVSYSRASSADFAETAIIRAQRSGLTKTAYVTVYPDDPLAYVVVQLTTNRPLTSIFDNQLTFINNLPGESMYASQIIIDGVQRNQGQPALGTSYSSMFLPAKQATLAVIMAPMSQQKVKVNQPVYYQYFAGAGSNMAVMGLNYQPLNPAELIEYRYAIYWNDGDQQTEVSNKATQMQSGVLNGRFRTP